MNQACVGGVGGVGVGGRGGKQDFMKWMPGSTLSGGSLSTMHFKLSQSSRYVV